MTRSLLLRPLLLVLLVPPSVACDGGPPWGAGGEEEPPPGREVFGPTAAYDRRLVFLGPGAELPTVAVFDFSTMSDSAGLHRGVRVRLADGVEWNPLLDERWEMEPMREPWRIVPRGPLRVIVGEAGELDALLFRGDVEMRLEAGSAIAEHSPDAGTQLVLRQGRLRLGDEPVVGILLDAQLARAINPAAMRTARRDTSRGDTVRAAAPTTAGEDSAIGPEEVAEAGTEASVPEDSAGTFLDPALSPAAGAEALLLDNSGYYVVFAASADGVMAWVHSAGRDHIRPAARLEPMSWEAFPEAGTEVPVAWRVSSPGGDLGGELRAESADRAILDGDRGPAVLGYVIVTGWIEDRGVRRNVYGLVRHVR